MRDPERALRRRPSIAVYGDVRAASLPSGRCRRRRPETVSFQAYRGTEPPRFVNGAERECAQHPRLVRRFPWEYEPRSFVLERDAEGRVTSAFTPDFYLPDQDLYIEVTVMKQSLVTRKNRKLREVRRLYPDVKVKLFYRRDIERLAQRYRLRIAS